MAHVSQLSDAIYAETTTAISSHLTAIPAVKIERRQSQQQVRRATTYAATCSAVTGVGEAGGRGGLVLR